jgi:hypothetical protein
MRLEVLLSSSFKKAMTYLDIVLKVRVQDLVQNLGDMIDSWLEGSYRDSCPDILAIVFLRNGLG